LQLAEDLYLRNVQEGSEEKTKYMSNNLETELQISGTLIEEVEEYSYLGQVVSFTGSSDIGLTIREKMRGRSTGH